MTTQEIYTLASELTLQQVENIVRDWEIKNEKEQVRQYNSLVKLGDSPQLACATTISRKYETQPNYEFLKFAYEQ